METKILLLLTFEERTSKSFEANKIKVKSYNDIVNLFVECLAGNIK